MSKDPNARLARLLETLARVAAKGDKGCLAVADAMHFALKDDMERAEACAAESARLAGVSASPWVLVSERLPELEVDVILSMRDGSVTSGVWSGEHWFQGDYVLDVPLAWRDWLEPYRPEETTDGKPNLDDIDHDAAWGADAELGG